jgi:hypothetical protein
MSRQTCTDRNRIKNELCQMLNQFDKMSDKELVDLVHMRAPAVHPETRTQSLKFLVMDKLDEIN